MITLSQAGRPGECSERAAGATSGWALLRLLALREPAGWVGGWRRLIGRVSSSSSVHIVATRLILWREGLVEGGIVARVVVTRWWWLRLLLTPMGVPVRPSRVPIWPHRRCPTPTMILVLEMGRIIGWVDSIRRSSLVIGGRAPVRRWWLRIIHRHILLVVRRSLGVRRRWIVG